MAGQTLQTTVLINAVSNGFYEVGSTLTVLGSMVDELSQKVINFGKDSINVYEDYEKSMAKARIALATSLGKDTKELDDAMAQLGVAAAQWAANDIFHIDDVSNAIYEAATASWTLEDILTNMPNAMELAEAGSIDLSDALHYIIKAQKAFGVEKEDLGDFIDMWIFAANSSTGTVKDFGDAMIKMGATMRFTDSKEELFALIGLMHDMGESGSTAATLLRTSIMRILAPSGVASKTMELLGATDEEINEIREDTSKLAALNLLESYGFNAYDVTGQAKPIIQIYAELGEVLAEIAGGYDNITKNQTTMGVLSTIFGNRGITGATDIVTGLQKCVTLRDQLLNGEAEGYGEWASLTMMDTLYGKATIYESKVENLQLRAGERLAKQIEPVLEWAGTLVDSLAELDDGKFNALVAGMEVIAAAGPGLMLAGGAFRLIGYFLTPAGGLGMGLIALTAAAAALKELEEADFARAFGTQEIDSKAIQSYVQGLGEDFTAAYTEVDKFREAVDNSVTSYQTASEAFSSDLLTKMLTSAALTDEDISKLNNLGTQMYTAIQEGITNSTAASVAYWKMLFGGDGTAEYDPQYQAIIDLTNQAYEEAIGQANAISEGLRDAMTSAFADGEVSEDEYAEILNWMRAYNEAIARASAEAQSEQDYITQQMLMHRAQTASLDEIKEIAGEVQTERDRVLSEAEDNYLRERFALEYRYDQAIASGQMINGAVATEEAKQAALAAVDERYNAHVLTQGERYDEILYRLWDSQIQQSELGDAYAELGALADRVLGGQLTADSAVEMFKDIYGSNIYAGEDDYGANNTRTRLGELLARQIAGYGGYEGLEARIADYEAQGDVESAARLRRLYAMQQINDNYAQTRVVNYSGLLEAILGDSQVYSSSQDEYATMRAQRGQFLDFMGDYIPVFSLDVARQTIASMTGGNDLLGEYMDAIGQAITSENVMGINAAWGHMGKQAHREYERMYETIEAMYDLEAVADQMTSAIADEGNAYRYEAAIWDLLYGSASTHASDFLFVPQIDTSSIAPVPLPITPKVEGEDSMTALQDQGVTVDVGADSTELQATIDGADGQTLIEYLDGDATGLSLKITDQDGKVLTEIVNGNTSALARAIQQYNGQTITVNISGRKLFAAGGRATSASIFGEDGAEWAIPEEHSERTAALLNAARAASGFTWADLLGRYGGLNANPNNAPTTIVYSPTINAADVTGVEQALLEDKKRLDKWFEEKKMRDRAEVYT